MQNQPLDIIVDQLLTKSPIQLKDDSSTCKRNIKQVKKLRSDPTKMQWTEIPPPNGF